MKKRKKQLVLDSAPSHNPVAKFAHQFNKAQRFEDKTQYRRHAKHKNREVSAKIPSIGVLAVTSNYFCVTI